MNARSAADSCMTGHLPPKTGEAKWTERGLTQSQKTLRRPPAYAVGQRRRERRQVLLELLHRAGVGPIVVGIVGAPEDAAFKAHFAEPRQAMRLVRFDRDEALLAEQFG